MKTVGGRAVLASDNSFRFQPAPGPLEMKEEKVKSGKVGITNEKIMKEKDEANDE